MELVGNVMRKQAAVHVVMSHRDIKVIKCAPAHSHFASSSLPAPEVTALTRVLCHRRQSFSMPNAFELPNKPTWTEIGQK